VCSLPKDQCGTGKEALENSKRSDFSLFEQGDTKVFADSTRSPIRINMNSYKEGGLQWAGGSDRFQGNAVRKGI